MRRFCDILCCIVIAFSALVTTDAAAQSSYDYINNTKRHIFALNDSIKKYCSDSVAIQRQLDLLPKSNTSDLTKTLNECIADTVKLASEQSRYTTQLDDINLKRAALNDSLAINIRAYVNKLLNSPCDPEAIKTLASYGNYPALKNEMQLSNDIKLLSAYEEYSKKLKDILTPVYNILERSNWAQLDNNSETFNTFQKEFNHYNKKVYKNYQKEFDNIPLLDKTINSIENLKNNKFANAKDEFDKIIVNLTPASSNMISPLAIMDDYTVQADTIGALNTYVTTQLESKRQQIETLKEDIAASGDDKRAKLEQQLNAIHIKCDDMREEKDIAIFKECLFYNLKQPYNDTIINALRPFIKETYFKSYQDFLKPYLHILDNYGAYTESLYSVMRYCHNTYCIKAHWERLPSDYIADVRAKLKNLEYYKLYYQRKDKVNSPHLNNIISEYIKLMDSGFEGCKTQYMDLLTKLRGKVPQRKTKENNNESHDNGTNNSENKQ